MKGIKSIIAVLCVSMGLGSCGMSNAAKGGMIGGAAGGAAGSAIGAGIGIGKIGGSAMDAMARQPEVMNKLFTNMIVAAALIEGVALFGAVIALLCSF